jgi:hypothetical protein
MTLNSSEQIQQKCDLPIKGPCHKILDLQTTSSGPLTLFAYGFVFAEIFDYEIDPFLVVSGVNDTADHKSDP